ncbi:MAG: LOG family protein, partial [Elusimicrobia bacterium]|nr:LOG family protein [Elusimicrobiota bacterium]
MPGSGKTPDLVLGDRIAELKARRSNTTDIGAPLHDAEAQLREHAERHGLGQGVVVIELTTFKAVPVEEVRQKLNRWSSERPLHFDHVLILAGDDLKIFERGQDGAFRLARGQELPAAAVAGRAADARAGRRLLSELGANADHPERAWQIWQAFRREHPEQVGELWPQVQRFLPFAGPLAPASPPPLDSERLLNEYLEPERLLREGGVQAAVFVSGGASVARGSRYYEEARRFGELVARYGQGLALATGGGPGIMEAANRGAFEAGGPSVGFRIILPAFVEEPNLYITPGLNFDFDNFQMRKLHLLRWASAVVCFPGAFGTLDELSEVLTLAQTGKLSPVPIILVGEREWKDL